MTFDYPSYVTGRMLTTTEAGTDGFVRTSPADLARMINANLDEATLARFLGSELRSGTAYQKAAVAHAIVNETRRRGWTLLRMATTVCRRGACTDTGLYGKQAMPGGNRYASTARDPSDRDLYVATMVLSGAWPDFTSGADQFLDPSDMEQLHASDPATYRSLDEVLASWGVPGRKEVVAVSDDLWLVRLRGGSVLPPLKSSVAGSGGAVAMLIAGLGIGWWWFRSRRRR